MLNFSKENTKRDKGWFMQSGKDYTRKNLFVWKIIPFIKKYGTLLWQLCQSQWKSLKLFFQEKCGSQCATIHFPALWSVRISKFSSQAATKFDLNINLIEQIGKYDKIVCWLYLLPAIKVNKYNCLISEVSAVCLSLWVQSIDLLHDEYTLLVG